MGGGAVPAPGKCGVLAEEPCPHQGTQPRACLSSWARGWGKHVTSLWSWLQNIHLVARWLGTLDKKLERYSTGSHEDYRVFISAEPAPSPETHIIPQGILENAIKITNEPPTGMHANLHKALDLFTQVRPCLFGLPRYPMPGPGIHPLGP